MAKKFYATARELEATASAIRAATGRTERLRWRDRFGFAAEILALDLLKPGTVSPETFGAVGDGVTDDTEAWKAALESGQVIRAARDYFITEPLTLSASVSCDGVIWYGGANTDTAVTISKAKNESFRLRVRRRTQDAGECTGILVENCNNCTFDLAAENFYYGLIFRGSGKGCCYNALTRAITVNSKYHLSVQACQDANGNNGWCNENYFYNGRCASNTGSLYKGADYGITVTRPTSQNIPNALIFWNWSLEGMLAAISGSHFINCVFENIRTDGCTRAADLGEGAVYNRVVISYGTTAAAMRELDNSVVSVRDVLKDELDTLAAGTGPLYRRTASNADYAAGVGLYRVDSGGTVTPMLTKWEADELGLKSKGGFVGFWINVQGCRRLRLVCHATGAYRPIAVPFDSNGDFLAGATVGTGTTAMTKTTGSGLGSFYVTGADAAASRSEWTIYFGDDVESVYVGVWGRSNDTIIRDLAVYGKASAYELIGQPAAVLDSIPTSQGFYPEQTVYQASGGNKWVWNGATWDAVSL